ncbi:MAG: RNA polymerase subunit sigma-70 [Eubacteriales bacterium]|nr:RNA polymerase subunit sigma-70 [Eubacteriales bacterium]
MNKSILYDYIDACELIKETEEDIRNHRKSKTVQDKVKGSNPEFPYQPMNFPVTGILESPILEDEEEKLLQEMKINAKQIKIQAEKVINMAPMRMQRIIRYKVFEGLTWSQVAAKMGRNATEGSVKMEFLRFMQEK